ncbi:MAG: virulence RhuM family protein, partial [Nitrospira sp.]|nr:virulence RhuM family protein [Nitrospira sp.]
MNEISIYETPNGTIEVRLERETIWLSQEQMATLFDVQKSAISKHLKNIFTSGELERGSTVSKMEIVQQEGARRITRQIEHFNLDAVISVGYRVNSARATRFRQWATRLLREHLTRGYTLNRHRFE